MAASEAEIVDASDRLVLPGLINAHGYGHGNLGKATAGRSN